MPITVQTAPHSTNLTLLATLKTELVITGTSQDEFLTALIGQASDQIRAMLGYRCERMEVSETLVGPGGYLLPVSNAPVVKVVSATLDGATQTLGDISIYDERAGLLYRTFVWDDTRPSNRPWEGEKLWTVRYWAGWLLPGDDMAANTISASGVDNSYNDSASGFPAAWLLPGDWINVSGFVAAANNGLKKIISATTAKIVVDSTLTTVTASPIISMGFRNLPYDLERACLDLVKVGYTARDRDPSIRSKSIGDVSVTYAEGGGSVRVGPWSPVSGLVGPYVRHVV